MNPKYVNKPDIFFGHVNMADTQEGCCVPMSADRRANTSQGPAATGQGSPEAIPYEMIELLFFAYRDFVGAPDRILADFNFGRAHHRVLHFVERRPGLTIAELLDILKITKQSLNRVLKELVETGFIEARPGREDRRQRLLHTTQKGSELANRLSRLQGERIMNALARAGAEHREAISAYLEGMIDPADSTTAATAPVRPDLRR
jgi:DNA-binding MarR family transcriptional regulator